jgi:hypothetical protein
MIRVGRGRSSSAQQRMRLARPRPARQHHVGSRPRHPADLATRSSPGRVDVSTRSNALYDRYATEPRVREVSPMAGHRAGQRAMRLLNGSDSRRLLAEPRESIRSERNGRRFRWSEAGWWAWEELNLRLHPETKIARVMRRGFEGDVVAEAWSWATGPPDSHPSWRPPAMPVLSAIEGSALCGRPFPQVTRDREV